MTPEEAKQLKPGDRVLVAAEVCVCVPSKDHCMHMTKSNNVAVKVARLGLSTPVFIDVSPEVIREKILPPRRKFRIGDIVSLNRIVHYVVQDEGFDEVLISEQENRTTDCSLEEADCLTLICPVEERHDKKGEI